jgi:hypothetical protein
MARKKKKPVFDAAALAAFLGKDVTEIASLAEEAKSEWDTTYVADAVLGYAAEDKKGWFDKTCKNCGRMFAADYKFISLCSTKCRKVALREIGIAWDPAKKEEDRWKPHRPPRVVPPDAYDILKGQIPGQMELDYDGVK